MTEPTELSASLEDYLEAIFWIVSESGEARPREVAQRLNVRAASVTGALRLLADKAYIHYTPYEAITLTDAGLKEARKISRRHEILQDFFTEVLRVDEALAEKGACVLEHGIPPEIVDRLVSFTEFVQSCPRAGKAWLQQFARHYLEGQALECPTCVSQCLQQSQKELDKQKDEKAVVSLSQIRPGHRCIVRRIRHKQTVTKRLVEMGIGRGAIIEVERVAPFGDPVEVKVRGYHLSLRQEEAGNIEVVEQ